MALHCICLLTGTFSLFLIIMHKNFDLFVKHRAVSVQFLLTVLTRWFSWKYFGDLAWAMMIKNKSTEQMVKTVTVFFCYANKNSYPNIVTFPVKKLSTYPIYLKHEIFAFI